MQCRAAKQDSDTDVSSSDTHSKLSLSRTPPKRACKQGLQQAYNGRLAQGCFRLKISVALCCELVQVILRSMEAAAMTRKH